MRNSNGIQLPGRRGGRCEVLAVDSARRPELQAGGCVPPFEMTEDSPTRGAERDGGWAVLRTMDTFRLQPGAGAGEGRTRVSALQLPSRARPPTAQVPAAHGSHPFSRGRSRASRCSWIRSVVSVTWCERGGTEVGESQKAAGSSGWSALTQVGSRPGPLCRLGRPAGSLRRHFCVFLGSASPPRVCVCSR